MSIQSPPILTPIHGEMDDSFIKTATWVQWFQSVSNNINGAFPSSGLPVYANNAAAVAGGLSVGSFYRTGANPDPVCVVH